MSLKHGLLGLLNEEPMTGYELDKVFKGSLRFFWHAKGSQIYNELDAMEKKGWLASERVIQDEKPNKRIYTLTAAGKAEFMDWLSSPETDIKNALNIKSAFIMRMFFAGNTNKAQVSALLRTFQEVCHVRRIEYKKVKESIIEDGDDDYVKLAAMYGEMMNQARLAWVEKAITHVENMEEN